MTYDDQPRDDLGRFTSNGPTLREYMEQRFVAHQGAHDEHMHSHEREHRVTEQSLAKAEALMDKRLNALNELRAEVLSDRNQFMRVDLARATLDAFSARLDQSEAKIDKAEGALNTWRFISGFLGVGGAGAVIWAILNAATP